MEAKEKMLGTWKLVDVGSSVTFKISQLEGMISIEATDEDNGEMLKVTNVRWIDGELLFSSYSVSSDYSVDYRVVAESKNRLLVYITSSSCFERVS